MFFGRVFRVFERVIKYEVQSTKYEVGSTKELDPERRTVLSEAE